MINAIETTPTTPQTFADAIGLVLAANNNSLDAVELIEALGLECADHRADLVASCNEAVAMLIDCGVIRYTQGTYSMSME
jgi:hypothetical protein